MTRKSKIYAHVAQTVAENVQVSFDFAKGRIPLLRLVSHHRLRDRNLVRKLLFEVETTMRAQAGVPMVIYRGSSVDRLPLIERVGIDVEPTNQMIFGCYDPTKSLEYGPLLIALDSTMLRKSWRDVAADASAQEIAEAEAEFGTNFLPARDGSRWYTRGRLDDPMVARPGEQEYGHYIPGDPWEALLGVWLFGDADRPITNA